MSDSEKDSAYSDAPASGKDSYERSIASRKRRSARSKETCSRGNQPSSGRTKKQFLVGIELSDVDTIRREVRMKLFDGASLPKPVEREWDSVLSSRKMPDFYVDQSLTFALTKEYAKAISRAASTLADWLVTAAISRVDRLKITPGFREAVWRECLDFAAQLSQWGPYGTWAGRVTGIAWDIPRKTDGAVDHERTAKAAAHRQKFFEERISMYWPEWLDAIDRGIELRRVLSLGRSTRADRKGELRVVIRLLKEKYPRYTQRQIAGKADDIFTTRNRAVPLLTGWKKHGVTTLVQAFDNPRTSNAIKKYISIT